MSKKKPNKSVKAVRAKSFIPMAERGDADMKTQRPSEEILAEMRLEESERKRLIARLDLTQTELEKLVHRVNLTDDENERLAKRLDLSADEMKLLVGHLDLSAQEKQQLAARTDLTSEERERLEGPLDLTSQEKDNKQREAAARMESQVSTATQMAYDLIIGGCERNTAIERAAKWVGENAPDILTKEDAADKIRTRLE